MQLAQDLKRSLDLLSLGLESKQFRVDLPLQRGPRPHVQAVEPGPRPDRALAALPKPLQTLLLALLDLKRDMAVDIVRQRLNRSNAKVASLETVLSWALAAMSTTAIEVRQVSLSVELQDATTSARVLELVDLQGTTLEDLHERIFVALQEAYDGLHKSMGLREKKATIIEPGPNSSALATQAAEASQKLRQRLKDLAEGPLANLFEVPAVSAAQGLPEVSVQAAPTVEAVDTSKSLKRILQLREASTLVRSALDGLHVDYLRLTQDQFLGLVAGLKECSRRIHLPPEEGPPVPSDDLREADKVLQTEIRYVLETLSTDTRALDAFLRYVKQEYNRILQEFEEEQSGRLHILAAQWCKQLEEAYDQVQSLMRLRRGPSS